jgi:hypothetical protein
MLGGYHAEYSNASTIRKIFSFRVTPQYTHDNYFMYIWHFSYQNLYFSIEALRFCDSALQPLCSKAFHIATIFFAVLRLAIYSAYRNGIATCHSAIASILRFLSPYIARHTRENRKIAVILVVKGLTQCTVSY